MFPNTKVYYIRHKDVWRHLATEEYLLDRLAPNERILYLWQSKDAVVFGKNQNPWRECYLPVVKRDKLKVARRLSGGGTVYQDTGNLNFTFFAPRELYDVQAHIDIIVAALKKKGITLTLEKGHKLALHGTKCSGNAFCFRKDRAFHHGTLLVDADLGKMRRYLQPFSEQIETHAVNSNKTDVINVSNKAISIDCTEVIDLIIKHFVQISGKKPVVIQDVQRLESNAIERLYRKYRSWEWVFGSTPKFKIHLSNQFSWGNCRLICRVDQGHVAHLEIIVRNLNHEPMRSAITSLCSCRFDSESVANRIRCHSKNSPQSCLFHDIASWVKEMNF